MVTFEAYVPWTQIASSKYSTPDAGTVKLTIVGSRVIVPVVEL